MKLRRFYGLLVLHSIFIFSDGIQADMIKDVTAKFTAYLQPAKKKIVVFTSKGGGGNVSASNAIRDYLKEEYDVQVVQILDVLQSFDTVKTLTFRYYDAEDLYNYMLTNNWFWTINQLFFKVGIWHMSWQRESIAKALDKYFQYNKYDMIISVIPVFNGPLLKAAKKHDIPFLVVPTELDATIVIHGLQKPDFKKFHYFLAFDDDEMRKKIEQAQISPAQITVSGFPIKPSFFKKKEAQIIRNDFDIPSDKPMVMVLMGAAGSKACFKYVRRITKGKMPVHIVACIGRNEDSRKRIEGIKLPSHVTISIVGFTDRIADLMSIADVLITKTGTVSFCEGVYSNIPMLLDNINGELAWEAFNVQFLRKNKLGDVVRSYKEVNPLLEKYLCEDGYKKKITHNLKTLKKSCFEDNLKATVGRMVEEAPYNPRELLAARFGH
jgi:processive 1,2-diacylglycerol beta-glucosyltransferase